MTKDDYTQKQPNGSRSIMEDATVEEGQQNQEATADPLCNTRFVFDSRIPKEVRSQLKDILGHVAVGHQFPHDKTWYGVTYTLTAKEWIIEVSFIRQMG